MEKEIIVKVTNMVKRFGITVALDDVSMYVRRGEVVGLIGENGSGKSTVTSIIAGMQKPDRGEMTYAGKAWQPSSMIEALNDGIGMIVQESGTIPGISVAENIFLGETERFRVAGLIRKKKMNEEAQQILNQIGANHIQAERMTASLDFQDRKLVEIAKVMRKKPQVLIVDETTTALSQLGRTIIYRIMEEMKKEQKAVIFISHDLDEIMQVCDTLTVLRDGKIIVTFEKEEFDENLIKTSMIGRELEGDYYRSDYDGSVSDEIVMEIKNGELADQLHDFDLQLHKGEILGVGGLSHCGMHTLGKVLFGAKKLDFGTVLCGGEALRDITDAMNKQIGYVSKDRDTESLNLNASIRDNIAIGGMNVFAWKKHFLFADREKQYVKKEIDDLSIKCRDMDASVSTLSGGNKQKVVFGKWIGRGSEILILDCPTRGVDIGVKQAMYQFIYRMKKEGKAIVIISEELSELIGMSDRLIIMRDGRITKEFMRDQALTEAMIIEHMI